MAFYPTLGMKPVHIRKEIEAFVAGLVNGGVGEGQAEGRHRRVEVGAGGKAVPRTTGIIVGYAHADAATNTDAAVALSV